jgi:predicted nucleic acid-binding protein
MKLVIDACVFVAEQIEGQPEFRDCAAFFDHCVRTGVDLFAPAIVLAEVAGAIARICEDNGLADVAVLRLHQFPRLVLRQIDMAFAEAAARAASRWMLRGADAHYAALARELKCPLITNDDELLKRCPATLKVMRPQDWLAARRA